MITYVCSALILFPILIYCQSFETECKKIELHPDYKISRIEDQIVEIENLITETSKYVNIRDQQIAVDSVDGYEVQFFDLRTMSNSAYAYKYDSLATLEVSGYNGYPLVIADLNGNGPLDIAGSYKINIDSFNLIRASILEFQYEDTIMLRVQYPDTCTKPIAITDLDKDGLLELNVRRKQHFYNFEQRTPYSYPDSLNIIHRMWYRSSVTATETFIDMDKDGITDVIYKGDDYLPPSGGKLYIAEYDPATNTFVKRFSQRPEDWRTSGISAGDFDYDGSMEFITGAIHGHVYGFENTGPDSYHMSFEDSLPTPNAYLNCNTNDIDDNGRREFFIGGSSYYWGESGTWTFWYESEGDDNYVVQRSIFLIGSGVLGTTKLYSYDANNDGKLDLVFVFAEHIIILTWNRVSREFDVFYFKFMNRGYTEIQSANIYDVDEDGGPDLFISLLDAYTAPRLKCLYFRSMLPLLSIDENPDNLNQDFILHQNYPNPFNNSTQIQFTLNKPSVVSVTIFDITGKEVRKILNNQLLSDGRHQHYWNGKNNSGKEVSTGMYYYELKSGSYKSINQMLLMK